MTTRALLLLACALLLGATDARGQAMRDSIVVVRRTLRHARTNSADRLEVMPCWFEDGMNCLLHAIPIQQPDSPMLATIGGWPLKPRRPRPPPPCPWEESSEPSGYRVVPARPQFAGDWAYVRVVYVCNDLPGSSDYIFERGLEYELMRDWGGWRVVQVRELWVR